VELDASAPGLDPSAALALEPQAASPNGQSNPSPTRLPRAHKAGKGTRLLVVLLALVVLAGGGWTAYHFVLAGDPVRTDLVLHKVRREKLLLTIVARGGLESAENNEITCRVKSGAKNSTVATTIKTIVDDGSHVKKGDLVIVLDDSGLEEQKKSQQITVAGANSNMIQAQKALDITKSQNESDIAAAINARELAVIDLEKYQKGDFPQSLSDVEGRIKVADSDLELQRDRESWARRMVMLRYISAGQAEAEKSKLQSLELALKKVQEEKRVLTDPKYGMKMRTETDLKNKVDEAVRALERVKTQAEAKFHRDETDFKTKKLICEQETVRLQDIEDEIKKCKIHAPDDGIVVYYQSEQSRFGSGSQQSIIAQGEPVREGQKLMRIPDLDHMMVNVRVHEASISRVQEGEEAKIRIDAYPGRILKGHVKSVATVAAQQDWTSAEIKVYTTLVAIDERLEGLRPGMNAEVTVFTDGHVENELLVPVQAVIATPDMGKYRKIFVRLPNGKTEARRILVGLNNEKMAEVKSSEWMEKNVPATENLDNPALANLKAGIEEGEEVVLNPKALLSDAEKAAVITGEKLVTGGKGQAPDGKGKDKGQGKGPPGGPPGGDKAPPGAQPKTGPYPPGGPGSAPGGPGAGAPGAGGPGAGAPGAGGPGASGRNK
jgi:multidrug efflux pump subunit AcrA (membrane-fusion protein)